MPAYQRLEVSAIRPAVPQPALRPVVPAYPTCYVYASRVEGSAMIRRAVILAESLPISAPEVCFPTLAIPSPVRHRDSAVAKSPSFPFNSFIFNKIRTLCFSCNRQVLYNQQNTDSLAQKNISGVGVCFPPALRLPARAAATFPSWLPARNLIAGGGVAPEEGVGLPLRLGFGVGYRQQELADYVFKQAGGGNVHWLGRVVGGGVVAVG